MREYVWDLFSAVEKKLNSGEVLTSYVMGEESDFCRFNKAKVRQSGKVKQGTLLLKLIVGKRQSCLELTLGFERSRDLAAIESHLGIMRDMLPHLPEDPFILYNQDAQVTEDIRSSQIPPAESIVTDVLSKVAPYDFVGIFSGGAVFRGFASSLGQRSWYQNQSFNLDWSLYLEGDNASKFGYGGFSWDVNRFTALLKEGEESLNVLRKPRKTLKPGHYRAYLAPAALAELCDLLAWSSFGAKSQKAKHSALMHLIDGSATLSPMVSMVENTAEGTSPSFDDDGFLKPSSVTLVNKGKFGEPLVSARSSREFGLKLNGANHSESPESLDIAAGQLPLSDVLRTLDTGLFVNNLWYCNYSDRTSCRITGMTRFATYWVENGKIVAPVRVMRFDDTLYHVLGKNLEALTKEREFILSAASYQNRSTSSHHMPGALVNHFQLTL